MTPIERSTVIAWDTPTRVFHWTLLALVVSAWISVEFAEDIGDELLKLHRWNGLAILTLLVWRLLWGVTGSSTSRFATFVKGPANTLHYGRELLTARARPYLGHNPLGALMVIGLIAALLLQASFGLFAVDDNDLTGGPLSRLLDESGTKFATKWHERIFENVLLPLAALHIATNLFYQLYKREGLITAMVKGGKPRRAYADANEAQIVSHPMLRALICLVLAAAIVFGTITALGGRFT